MKEISRIEFMKQCGRWSAFAGLAGFGAVLLSREKKVSCNDQCGNCPEYVQGKCGIGIK